MRPGIIPLRPLTLGDLYGAVIKAVRGNVAATVGLAALTSIAFLLPLTALGTWATSSVSIPTTGAGGQDVGAPPVGLFGTYLPSLGTFASTILLAGFMAYVIGQAVMGRKVTLQETWAGTKGRLWRLVGATLVVGVAMALLALVLIAIPLALVFGLSSLGSGSDGGAGQTALAILGVIVWVLVIMLGLIYASTRLSFVTPAIVLESTTVFTALARSWRLVGGMRRKPFWRIFGIRLLTSILVGVAASVVSLPMTLVLVGVVGATLDGGGDMSALFVAQTVASGVAGILAGALTTPFTAGVDALLYVDARIRREGLDVALMQTLEGSRPAPWMSAATN